MELTELTHLVDEYCVKRENRLEADKYAKQLKADETELKERVIAEMLKHDCGMVGGTYKKVTVQTKLKPMAADWEQVYGYIREHDAFELLQRRLNEGAVKERLEAGEDLTGVEFYELNDLSVAKL